MLLYKKEAVKEFIKNETENIPHRRDFSSILERDYVLRENTHRAALVTGLRSTGKTIGILQSIADYPSDNIIYFSPTSKDEHIEKEFVYNILKDGNYDLIILDEYSWLTTNHSDEDILADYLAGKAMDGIKIIITGTDSTKINSLKNTDFIHRSTELNTTFFSYDEYKRLFDLKDNAETMREYLTKGGLFENQIYKSYGSMRDYIQNAIISNLSAYYNEYDKELIKATIYTVFYECVCNCYNKHNEIGVPIYNYDRNVLSYEEYLDNFGINPAIQIPTSTLNEISDKLQEIGVVVKLNDLRIPKYSRSYITNQSISAQMTKCIFELDEIPDAYLGHLYEASVVCNIYMKMVNIPNSPYSMNYLHGRRQGEEFEIDFILSDKDRAYLFDCKLNSNSNMQINDRASIVKDIIPNLLGDKDVEGRFIIYQGDDKVCNANGKDLFCTNNWDLKVEDFNRYVKTYKDTDFVGNIKSKKEINNVSQDDENNDTYDV